MKNCSRGSMTPRVGIDAGYSNTGRANLDWIT